ncbi:MAG: hypothetical protein KY396_00160 [Actinobacteria bacterium]|nr:hypothetical protein [Actinomycetota bacterium]
MPTVRRILTLTVGAAAGALAAAAAVRRVRRAEADAPARAARDPRAEELRRKLAEARESAAADDDLDAEGAAGEALVEERPTREDNPISPAGGEVDDARRRIHEEGRAAAEDMRRGGSPDE